MRKTILLDFVILETMRFINKSDVYEKQAFIAGHELGHLILHKEIFAKNPEKYHMLFRIRPPGGNDVLEAEADCFSLNLLIPSHLISPVLFLSPAELYPMFGVSAAMMSKRLALE